MIREMIKHYCREAGVRNLQQQLGKLARKAAYNVSDGVFCVSSVVVSDPLLRWLRGGAVEAIEYGPCVLLTSAPQIVANQVQGVVVTDSSLTEYLGKPLYSSQRMYDVTPVGVVSLVGQEYRSAHCAGGHCPSA